MALGKLRVDSGGDRLECKLEATCIYCGVLSSAANSSQNIADANASGKKEFAILDPIPVQVTLHGTNADFCVESVRVHVHEDVLRPLTGVFQDIMGACGGAMKTVVL